MNDHRPQQEEPRSAAVAARTRTRKEDRSSVAAGQAVLGRVVILSLGSQAASAAAAITALALTPNQSDVYVIGQQVGTAALGAVSLSVTYLLAIGRPNWNGWRRASQISSLCSLLAGIAATILLRSRSDLTFALCIVPGIFGIGGAFLASAGVVAVRRACLGRPIAMAGITIGPSTLLFAATLLSAQMMRDQPGSVWLYVPCAAWCLASILSLCVVRAMPLPSGTAAIPSPDETTANRNSHLLGASLSSGLGIAVPMVLMISLTSLPSGTASIVGIANRVGTSVVALCVNSVLLVRINWQSPAQPHWRIVSCLSAVTVVGAAAASFLAQASSNAALVVTLGAWMTAIIATPIATRLAHATRRGRIVLTKAILELTFAPVILGMAWAHPSSSSLFLSYIAISGVSIVGVAAAFRRPSLAFMSLASVGAALIAMWAS